MNPLKLLFITTSQGKLGDGLRETGVWLEQLAVPYYLFRDAGAGVTLASPGGGEIPIDPKSQSLIVATPSTKRFAKDVDAMNLLAHSILLDEVIALDYDGVFIVGGHGALWDLIDNKILTQVLETFNRENKPIGAVAHGVIGLAGMKNELDEFLITGKQLTAYANSEEMSAGLIKIIPFMVESELRARGAIYSKGPDYLSHVVTDGNLITGQNAASADEVVKRMFSLIRDREYNVVVQPALV
jgi:putative intracellular protease/amidase